MKSFPSYIFAAFGVALLVLGIAAMAYGDTLGEQIMGALVAIIGILQIIFGGVKRKTEELDRDVDVRDSGDSGDPALRDPAV